MSRLSNYFLSNPYDPKGHYARLRNVWDMRDEAVYYNASKAFSTNALTILAHFYLDATLPELGMIFNMGTGGGTNGYPLRISQVNTGGIQVEIDALGDSELCYLTTVNTFIADGWHSLFFSYDGATGAGDLKIDGVSDIDTGHGAYSSFTPGTIQTNTNTIRMNAAWWSNTNNCDMKLGYFVLAKTYHDNYGLFFDDEHRPRTLDVDTWSEFEGVQPYIYSPNGFMDAQLGSWGAFSVSGAIKHSLA